MAKMSREDLFREIGEIDEAYVEEAERARRKRGAHIWPGRTLAAAACLALCVGAGYMTVLFTQRGGDTGGSAGGGVMNTAQEPYSMAEDTEACPAGGASFGGREGEQAAAENAPEEAPGRPETASGGTNGRPETASGGVPGGTETASGGTNGGLETAFGGTSGGTETAPGGSAGTQAASREEVGNECGAEPGEVSAAVNGAQKDSQDRESEEKAWGRQEVLEVQDALELCGESAVALNWEAARTDEVYGRYVDVQIPEGYVFDGGIRSTSLMRVTFSGGGEEVSVTCRQADEGVSDWLADVEKPKEYDLGLYSIPWGESVPQELMTRVLNATFRPEQITLEIVEARTWQAQEEGEVAGSRTQIGILYSDNVLVEITGKGPSAEEIYAMIYREN